MEYEVFAGRERTGWADPAITEGYISGFGPVVDAAGEAQLDRVPPESRVLDMCCGQGTLTRRLVEVGHAVTGLDFSPDMLSRASVAAPGAVLVEGDAQDLPFDDGSFDAVTCNFGIMHIPDQPRALSEVARVLKPGGVFSMTAWVGPEASDVFRLVLGTVRANLPEGISPPPQPDFFLYGRPEEAAAMLSENGLEVVDQVALPLAWDLASPRQLFEIFRDGTVSARMALMALDDAGRDRVAEIIAKTIASDYRAEGGYRVPAPVAHIVARTA